MCGPRAVNWECTESRLGNAILLERQVLRKETGEQETSQGDGRVAGVEVGRTVME